MAAAFTGIGATPSPRESRTQDCSALNSGTVSVAYEVTHEVLTCKLTGKADADPEYEPSDDDDCKGINSDGCPCGTVRCSTAMMGAANMLISAI